METILQSLQWVLEHLAVLQPLPGVADPVCFEDFLSQAWRMHSQHDKSRPGALQVSATRQAGPPAGTYVGAAGCCQASASHLLRPACMKAKLGFFFVVASLRDLHKQRIALLIPSLLLEEKLGAKVRGLLMSSAGQVPGAPCI